VAGLTPASNHAPAQSGYHPRRPEGSERNCQAQIAKGKSEVDDAVRKHLPLA
jgi:hypothetical protein